MSSSKYLSRVVIDKKAKAAVSLASSSSIYGDHLLSAYSDKSIRFLDAASGVEKVKLQEHKRGITCLAISTSADAPIAATVSRDCCVNIWSAETFELLSTITIPVQEIKCIEIYQRSETFIILGSRDSQLIVWDFKRSILVSNIKAHKGAVNCLAVTSLLPETTITTTPIDETDSLIIVTGGADRNVRVWDLKTKKRKKKMKHTRSVTAVAIASRGIQPIVASGGPEFTIRLWDLETGIQITSLDGNLGTVRSLRIWEGYEILVISASEDGTVRVFDLLSGECVCTLVGHESSVDNVVIANTTQKPSIVSCSNDRTVRFWDLDAIIGTYFRSPTGIPGQRNDVPAHNPHVDYVPPFRPELSEEARREKMERQKRKEAKRRERELTKQRLRKELRDKKIALREAKKVTSLSTDDSRGETEGTEKIYCNGNDDDDDIDLASEEGHGDDDDLQLDISYDDDDDDDEDNGNFSDSLGSNDDVSVNPSLSTSPTLHCQGLKRHRYDSYDKHKNKTKEKKRHRREAYKKNSRGSKQDWQNLKCDIGDIDGMNGESSCSDDDLVGRGCSDNDNDCNDNNNNFSNVNDEKNYINHQINKENIPESSTPMSTSESLNCNGTGKVNFLSNMLTHSASGKSLRKIIPCSDQDLASSKLSAIPGTSNSSSNVTEPHKSSIKSMILNGIANIISGTGPKIGYKLNSVGIAPNPDPTEVSTDFEKKRSATVIRLKSNNNDDDTDCKSEKNWLCGTGTISGTNTPRSDMTSSPRRDSAHNRFDDPPGSVGRSDRSKAGAVFDMYTLATVQVELETQKRKVKAKEKLAHRLQLRKQLSSRDVEVNNHGHHNAGEQPSCRSEYPPSDADGTSMESIKAEKLKDYMLQQARIRDTMVLAQNRCGNALKKRLEEAKIRRTLSQYVSDEDSDLDDEDNYYDDDSYELDPELTESPRIKQMHQDRGEVLNIEATGDGSDNAVSTDATSDKDETQGPLSQSNQDTLREVSLLNNVDADEEKEIQKTEMESKSNQRTAADESIDMSDYENPSYDNDDDLLGLDEDCTPDDDDDLNLLA